MGHNVINAEKRNRSPRDERRETETVTTRLMQGNGIGHHVMNAEKQNGSPCD